MKLSLITAMGENRVIGTGGKIPWHLSADFARFKATTMGHPIIMGRKTFESIGRPLPGRTNIVVTRDADYRAEGCLVAGSLEGAIALAKKENASEAFVIGGEQIYKAALGMAQVIYLTLVHGTFEGDAFFPELDPAEWKLVASEPHAKDAANPFDYDFLIYSASRPSL
ncbi:MAG TPA: dihydrofolate reductase [Candidatus Paceibacterota bacterium]|nr:dihydrofolate reductase [Candidatus Paceibacterota bacterium]